MIIATFDYGFNLRVTDANGTIVWSGSTGRGEAVAKDLPAGTYTVWVGVPEGGKSVQAQASDLIGVQGTDASFSLHDAQDKYDPNPDGSGQLRIATFEYGLNVNVTDASGKPVWKFSTASGEWVSKRLDPGQYTVVFEDSGQTRSIQAGSTDVVGAMGGSLSSLVLSVAQGSS